MKNPFKSKLKETYHMLVAFFAVKSLIKDGKFELSDDQKAELKNAFGDKINLEKVTKSFNQELADMVDDLGESAEDQKADKKEKLLQELIAQGLAQEDAEDLAGSPEAKNTEKSIEDLAQELIAQNQEVLRESKKKDKLIEKLLRDPEPDSPLAQGNRNNLKEMHSSTHLFSSNNAFDAFENRPWNQRAAGLITTPTDFSAEDSNELQTLKGDIDLYYRQNPQKINSLFRDSLGLPSFWTLVSGVADKIATANIVAAEVSQARKLPYLAKNKSLIQPEENKVFPVQVDITHQGYYLQKIEASWLNMMNKEGSSPFKMSFVQFLLAEFDKRVRQEDRKVAINGIHVKTPDNATVPGKAIHRGDGLLLQLWRAYWVDNKFRVANIAKPTTANIVDHVKEVIEKNVPEESKNQEGLVFYLSPYWMRRYKERKRELFGLNQDYNGKEVNEIDGYLNYRFVTLRDLEGSDFMFITDENNIKLYEYLAKEKSIYRFQNILRDTHIFADYKWGAGFDHIGTTVSDTDPDAFKVQTVWCNMPPYIYGAYASLYDDTTGIITMPYSNIHTYTGWSTNITQLKGTFAGQVIKIKGDTTVSGLVKHDNAKIKLTGNTDFDLSTGGTLTLRVGSDLIPVEVKRTSAPETAPTGDTNYVDSIDATQGVAFNFTGEANDVLDEILNGFENQEIVVNGGSGGTVTIDTTVEGNIKLISDTQAVLADGADNITFVKIDGVWTEVDRTIAV